MTIAIILGAGILTVLLGRWMFGKWFNHVGLYGLTWSASLALFHTGLVNYYPLQSETWLLIIAGWLAFILGSATFVAARFSLRQSKFSGSSGIRNHASVDEASHSLLYRLLFAMNAVIVLDAIYEVHIAATLSGGVSNILTLGNLLYHLRTSEGLPGMIPYLSSMGFTACLFAGIHTSRAGKLKVVTIIPLLVILVISVVNMSRVNILVATIMFSSGIMLNRKRVAEMSVSKSRVKIIFSIVLVVALLASGAELIRSNRGTLEGFAGTTAALRKFETKGGSFVTPSIIMYATAHHGVFNQYLKRGVEDPIVGRYTFAPFWRVLAKFGFNTKVNFHQPFYRTPAIANTGSYLREFHADFGVAGCVFGPFALGFIVSLFWFRSIERNKLLDFVLLAHMMVVVGLTVIALATQMGPWLASLIFGIPISFVHDRMTSGRRLSKPILRGYPILH